MKKINPLKLAIGILGFASVASLVGSISGTVAWYAFSTRALISYSGTSVQSTTQLQIGIKSDVVVNFTTNAALIDDVTFEDDLYYDDVNDPYHLHKLYRTHYYFMKVGSGGMPAAIINDYLSTKGYATNVLEPLSTYSYTPGGLLYRYNDLINFWEVSDAQFSGNSDPWNHDFGETNLNDGDTYFNSVSCKYYYRVTSFGANTQGGWKAISAATHGDPNTNNVSGANAYYIDADAGIFNLRNRPITNNPDAEKTAAEITKYVEIPFVFRVLSVTTDPTAVPYVVGHDVFLSGATAIAAPNADGITAGNNIHNSIRLYIDRANGANYILNPSSSINGRDKVAGVLNLTGGTGEGTGYFDYDNVNQREYLYGDYEWKKDKNLDNSLSNPLEQDSGLVDINGTGKGQVESTFTSRHHRGIRYFSDLDSCITPHYANYLGTRTVYPSRNNGVLSGDYAVCKTGGAADKYLGTFNMKIYLEGWDFSVVDSQLQNKFYLGLTFEINIVK